MDMGQPQRRKRKPGAMYTQHAERGIEATGEIAEASNQTRRRIRQVVLMRFKSHSKPFMIVIRSHGFPPGGNRVLMAVIDAAQAVMKILQSVRGRLLNTGVSTT